ncbi:bis(5'-nucleosyl)-tetraphosphatase PrpE [Bacillus sp. SG-1]|uniref:bis(5'-nucleosyl)-tetraphosphatase PrpE n=1 Tax=Bacillus sp. SG-1 TaxID=161544 RepID=UPI0001544E49|nr:bis(5'-nucleosyl)-tetraphosphatase PrpE [Bacillus sp. SG-1]EDL63747.1 diadenosine tetraphosphatase [Bacillus sp. SG-1]
MKLDIIGDIHGCYAEFKELTMNLGYQWDSGIPVHPDGRMLGFVGDLTDRGPNSLKVVETVWKLHKEKLAYYVPGNHCNKLYRYFLGNNVKIVHGLETTVEELGNLPEGEIERYKEMFIELYENSPLYQQLDSGKLIIAHAGIKEEFIGKQNNKVKTFVLYGDITGETNEDGTPVRRDWAFNYKGEAYIVYGHTPFSEVRNINRTYNIDTGAVFGGKLSSLSYPELRIESVKSSMPYVAEKFRDVNPGRAT